GSFTLNSGNGDTLLASNGGSLTLTGQIAAGASSSNVFLNGSNPGSITGAIVDNGISTAGVSKGPGAGTWTLSGANTYTRQTTVLGGTLRSGADNAFGNAPLTFGDASTASVGTLD